MFLSFYHKSQNQLRLAQKKILQKIIINWRELKKKKRKIYKFIWKESPYSYSLLFIRLSDHYPNDFARFIKNVNISVYSRKLIKLWILFQNTSQN